MEPHRIYPLIPECTHLVISNKKNKKNVNAISNLEVNLRIATNKLLALSDLE